MAKWWGRLKEAQRSLVRVQKPECGAGQAGCRARLCLNTFPCRSFIGRGAETRPRERVGA